MGRVDHKRLWSRCLAGGAGVLALVLAETALAGAKAPAPAPRALLDRSHAAVGDQMVRFIDSIDRFFGDQQYDGLRNESYLRLAPGLRIRRGPNFAFKPRVRGSLQLPRTERRVALVLSGRDANGNLLDDGTGQDDDFAAALRAALVDNPLNQVDLSVGSHFRPEPDPFVKLQFEWLKPFDRFALRPVLSGYWELEEGFGERTRLDFDYRVSEDMLLRLRGDANYGESTSGVEFRTSVTYYFKGDDNAAWQFQWRLDSQTRPRSEVVQTRGFVRYRWSMFRSWLFFEVEPGLRFRRQDDFRPAPELTLRFEVVFMGSPSPRASARDGEAPRVQQGAR